MEEKYLNICLILVGRGASHAQATPRDSWPIWSVIQFESWGSRPGMKDHALLGGNQGWSYPWLVLPPSPMTPFFANIKNGSANSPCQGNLTAYWYWDAKCHQLPICSIGNFAVPDTLPYSESSLDPHNTFSCAAITTVMCCVRA